MARKHIRVQNPPRGSKESRRLRARVAETLRGAAPEPTPVVVEVEPNEPKLVKKKTVKKSVKKSSKASSRGEKRSSASKSKE
jgi:hypothetical protein